MNGSVRNVGKKKKKSGQINQIIDSGNPEPEIRVVHDKRLKR